MAGVTRNNMRKQLNGWYEKRKEEFKRDLRITGEKIANRLRATYPGLIRSNGVDLGGWKEGHLPKLHGQLGQSVRIDYSRIDKLQIVILIGKEYGADIEFGTSTRAARPAVRNALRIEAANYAARIVRFD